MKHYQNLILNIKSRFILTPRKKKLLSITILCLLGVMAYSNTFRSPFHFDDIRVIVENSAITDLYNLKNIFSFYPARFITFLSFALNYHLHQFNVPGFHIFNLAVHLGCGILVWWFSLLTFSTPVISGQKIAKRADLIALFAGLVFLAHPLQTQGVTYIYQRATSLATLFYLSSLCFYIKARLLTEQKISPTVSKCYYGFSLLATIIAMFTKEITVTIPLAICLYEFSFFRAKRRRLDWKSIAPFLFTLPVIFLTLAFTKFVNFTDIYSKTKPLWGISSRHYLLTQFRVLVTYLRLVFLPLNQNLDYDYPISTALTELPVLASLLLLAGILILAVRLFRNYRLISFGIFWFFLTLLPESGIIPLQDVIFEHRLYLPMLGFSIFLVSSLAYLLENKSLKILPAILVIPVVVYAGLAYSRNNLWKDDIGLWHDTVRKSPGKARPYNNLGLAYQNEGSFLQAFLGFNEAIKLDPDYANAYNNRGNIYHAQGRFKQALADFDRAIQLNPGYAKAYNNRGVVYQEQGNFEQAIADFNQAIKIDPYYLKAYNNRKLAYQGKANPSREFLDFNNAADTVLAQAEVCYNRGLVYQNQGDLEKAILEYSNALEADPNLAVAYNNRGVAYQNQGDFKRAFLDFDQAIKIHPDYASAYSNRGAAYQNQGDLKSAILDYSRAIEIDPQNASAYYNRAAAYSLDRKDNLARQDLLRAQELGVKLPSGLPEILQEAVVSGKSIKKKR